MTHHDSGLVCLVGCQKNKMLYVCFPPLVSVSASFGPPELKEQNTCRLLLKISALTHLYPSVPLIVSHCKWLLVAGL